MAVFLAGIICVVMGFELMRMGTVGSGTTLQDLWLSGTAPWGFLVLFIGIGLGLIGFGYLAAPLKPWRTAADEYGDERTLPPASSVDRGAVAQEARVLFILILVVGLLIIEAIPMYNMARASKLFVRDNCTQNCSDLTTSEIAFLFDLIPIALANAFVIIMLFVFIQP